MLSNCRLVVSLARQTVLADRSCLVASCHIEGEMKEGSLQDNTEGAHLAIKEAYAVNARAVHDELARQRRLVQNHCGGDDAADVGGGGGDALGDQTITPCDPLHDCQSERMCPMVRERLTRQLARDAMELN